MNDVHNELKKVVHDGNYYDSRKVFILRKDQTIGWTSDKRWDKFMDLVDILPDE